MPAPKGTRPPRAGMGRPKGAKNKITQDVRASIALIAERNIGVLEQWLDEVAAKDPARAAELFLRIIEYHIPKLGRTELTGADGKPLEPPVINVNFPAKADNQR